MHRAGEQNCRNHRGNVGAGESERQQTISVGEPPVEYSRARVTAFATRANFQIVGRDQRNFGRSEESLHDKASSERDNQPDHRHRWSLTSSTAAPRTRSTVASNSPSLNFSPVRGTRPRRRRIRLLSVFPPP